LDNFNCPKLLITIKVLLKEFLMFQMSPEN